MKKYTKLRTSALFGLEGKYAGCSSLCILPDDLRIDIPLNSGAVRKTAELNFLPGHTHNTQQHSQHQVSAVFFSGFVSGSTVAQRPIGSVFVKIHRPVL